MYKNYDNDKKYISRRKYAINQKIKPENYPEIYERKMQLSNCNKTSKKPELYKQPAKISN